MKLRRLPQASRLEPALEKKSEVQGIPAGPIVFYDGVCGLCDRFIHFLLRVDRRGKFFFGPLQGVTAARVLVQTQGMPSTVVLWHTGRASTHSTAVVRILWLLGRSAGMAGVGWWALGSALWLVPKPLRDWGYGFVAKHRYRWFGQYDVCRLPVASVVASGEKSDGEISRFLP